MDREESVLGQAMEEKKNLRLPPISFYSYCCYIVIPVVLYYLEE